MPAELQPDLELQIAHLLLIDVVGYSKLLVNEQIELLQKLNRLVRSTGCFRAAEAKDKLIRLPTGDGMALLFFESLEQPARCALEISRALKDHAEIQVRMGIHSGPVNQVTDVNDRINIAGAGINIAQRVLDCGDAGHILVSKHVADDLAQYRHWNAWLRDLGECEVKHGVRLHLFNLCKDGVGNPDVPEKLRRRIRWKPAPRPVRPIRSSRWPAWALVAVLFVFIAGLAAMGTFFWQRRSGSSPSESATGTLAIPTKSIAVMPFANLSDDKQNAYFADGVQDEILTNLARVADLKVISRTSVMQYRGSAQRNAREISKQLGVSYLLEGSVQRSGNRVRLTTQLIDARTDAHVWAEHYDRDLADVFTLENELSEQIVAQLKLRLSPDEKAAIEHKPTADLVAYDLYTRAKLSIERAVFGEPREVLLSDAIRMLEEAVKRDPSFALAYYQLAHAHDQMYWVALDRTPERLAKAQQAIDRLRQLAPASGEAHLAVGKHLYWGYRDYERARGEIDQSMSLLPNDPAPYLLAGYVDRRQGRWDESLQNMQRALEHDPRNWLVLQQIALSYEFLRRYPEMATALDRALVLLPNDQVLGVKRARVDLDARADTKPLQSFLAPRIAAADPPASAVVDEWFTLSLYQRDFDTAQRALDRFNDGGPTLEGVVFPRAWAEGLVARFRGNKVAADAAFTNARNSVAQRVQAAADDGALLATLALIDAALGRKEEAVREIDRASQLLPLNKDAIDGAVVLEHQARICAWIGDKEQAFKALSAATAVPGHLHYGDLKLDPSWDGLRSDPRFDRILATLGPK